MSVSDHNDWSSVDLHSLIVVSSYTFIELRCWPVSCAVSNRQVSFYPTAAVMISKINFLFDPSRKSHAASIRQLRTDRCVCVCVRPELYNNRISLANLTANGQLVTWSPLPISRIDDGRKMHSVAKQYDAGNHESSTLELRFSGSTHSHGFGIQKDSTARNWLSRQPQRLERFAGYSHVTALNWYEISATDFGHFF